jgi:glucosamine-phosphate N-acetyltransferase
MAFRLLTLDDYEAYHELINEFRPTQFNEEQFGMILTEIERSGAIWVYDEEGVLLATGTIIYEYKFIMDTCIYAHIEDVCVSASRRRQGLGKRLIQHLIGEARDCYKITLDCSDENVPFYEACGLERRGNQLCQLVENLLPKSVDL